MFGKHFFLCSLHSRFILFYRVKSVSEFLESHWMGDKAGKGGIEEKSEMERSVLQWMGNWEKWFVRVYEFLAAAALVLLVLYSVSPIFANR